jgi:nuclear transcription factor Y gamma
MTDRPVNNNNNDEVPTNGDHVVHHTDPLLNLVGDRFQAVSNAQAPQGIQLPAAYQQSLNLNSFWQQISQEIEVMTGPELKNHLLPLSRIKKIMKSDEDVKMISAEVLDLFSKACELFLRELTLRAWLNTEENRRKTLQKNDVALAVAKTDSYDFLIDIVPREDVVKPKKAQQQQQSAEEMRAMGLVQGMGEYMPQYYSLPDAHGGNTVFMVSQQQLLALQQAQQGRPYVISFPMPQQQMATLAQPTDGVTLADQDQSDESEPSHD